MILKEQLDIEEAYEQAIEPNVEAGVIHPRLIRWWNESSQNDKPVEVGLIARERYKICKGCDEFNNAIKFCKVCSCFMPIKTQLAKSKCPKGKWL